MILPYAYVSELTDEAHQAIYEEVNAGKRHHQTVEPAREVLKRAFHKVFPGEPVRVVQSEDSCIYSPLAIQRSVVPERFVEAQIRRETDQLITFEDDVLFLDIETHNAERLYDMDRREFFRLGQYAWGEGQVQVTTDIDEVLAQIGKARLVYAHNGHNFDFNALLGDDALHLAYESKLFDTFVFAALHFPAPTRYLHSNGRNYTDYNTKPGHTARWLGLENLAFQFGFPGKLGNLQELAARHNPPKTKVADLDYGLIPLSDPKFLAYAEQDIIALRDLTRSMLSVVPVDAYSEREQFKWALLAQFSRNGCAVDVPEIQRRVQRSADQAQAIMAELVEQYDFPTEGKAPWSSKLGKQALERILADYGITPDTVEWERTASGALSFGKDVMLAITKGTAAESVGQAIAALQGDRGLPQQVLDYLAGDGLIHPRIESLQRSGRSCLPTTHKLLTKRGILSFDEVRVGDETLDMRNRWVKVTAKHFYKDAPVIRWENDRCMVESTEEHRWVQRTENTVRSVEPLNPTGNRRVLQLTPDAYPFDHRDLLYPQYMTEREIFAAVIGLLVTDGYCGTPSDRKAPKFRIYQTEGKFYDTFIKMLPPDWVTNDNSRFIGGCKTPLHEVSLKREILQPLLDEAGLDYSSSLRHSKTVFHWLATLSQSETLAFITSVYLADGSIHAGTPVVSSLNKDMVPVFQIAAYRCGKRSKYGRYQNSRGDENGDIRFLRDRVNTRGLLVDEHKTEYTSDVWCVSTETGTFTAWYPEGKYSGPYLTGNSVTSPGLTTWGSRTDKAREDKEYFIPRPGNVLIELDLSNADQRAVAFMSKDPRYAERFLPGVDGHEITGRLMFGDAVYDSDPTGNRNIAKALSHAYAYGAGAKKLALTAQGRLAHLTPDEVLELAELFVSTMQSHYPQMTRWQNEIRREGGSGWVYNLWGRPCPVDPERAYTQAPALAGQSSTTELLLDCWINMYERDPSSLKRILFPIHDAILCEVPLREAETFSRFVVSCADQTINGIEIFLEAGHPGKSWSAAMHG